MAHSYVFWFHYNKPASNRAGKPQVTVKFRGKCLIVDNVKIDVPTFGFLRENEQPHFVIKGYASNVEVNEENIAHIY